MAQKELSNILWTKSSKVNTWSQIEPRKWRRLSLWTFLRKPTKWSVRVFTSSIWKWASLISTRPGVSRRPPARLWTTGIPIIHTAWVCLNFERLFVNIISRHIEYPLIPIKSLYHRERPRPCLLCFPRFWKKETRSLFQTPIMPVTRILSNSFRVNRYLFLSSRKTAFNTDRKPLNKKLPEKQRAYLSTHHPTPLETCCPGKGWPPSLIRLQARIHPTSYRTRFTMAWCMKEKNIPYWNLLKRHSFLTAFQSFMPWRVWDLGTWSLQNISFDPSRRLCKTFLSLQMPWFRSPELRHSRKLKKIF